jgi:serine/threonine protein kinase/TolB-like protein/Flp pilus assembly protein TadD
MIAKNRWDKVQELFAASADMDPDRRRRFLLDACEGDAELLHEVQSLVAGDQRASNFLETPAMEISEWPEHQDRAAVQLVEGEQLGPYRIDKLLASGGMGEVYSATDTRLDRPVAIKLLPLEFSRDVQSLKRFRREARAASALNHAHICSLHDIGEHNGLPFLVLELLEGRSLKEFLTAGPVSAHKLVPIAIQIAGALEAAHAKGILHRDIKPANIFITSEGEAKILDFGLAKLSTDPLHCQGGAASALGISTEASVSMPGWTPGTVAYMSPEQARGEPLDARTDLFSLGVTLYEMATGRKPFHGETPALLRDAIIASQPAHPRQLNAAVPARLERIILKLLEKRLTSRYQSAGEFRADLERLLPPGKYVTRWRIAATGFLLLALAVSLIGIRSGWLGGKWGGSTTARLALEKPIRRVAVLPLRNILNRPDQEHLTEGIGDAVADDLANLKGLRVISRSSAIQYRESKKSPSEIARELGVDVVVGGSALLSGTRLEVHLQLTRANSEAPFWAESFEGDFRATRGIRTEVARAVAREVRLQLPPGDEARVVKERTASREALENCLRARHYWAKRTDADIERAAAHFKAAIDADPAYADAYAGLADCYNQFATVAVGRPPGENRALAIAAARKALEIDDQHAEAHAALGFAKLYNWDWAGAELELTRALDLNPSYASAHVWHASSLVIRHRLDEAVREVERAAELDPLSPITQTQVGWIRWLAGRTQDAITQYHRVLAGHPDYPWALWQLGQALCDADRPQEAIGVLEKGVAASKNNFAMVGVLGRAYAQAGRRQDAQNILARLRNISARRYVSPAAIEYICLGLDDRNGYFQALEEGFRQRINHIAYLSVTPSPERYPAVRADPRFQDLLRRLSYDRE